MDADAIRRALRRIAHEIIERNPDLASAVLAGIPSRGVEISRRIAALIESFEGVPVETGIIDVSMHRDDVGQRANLPVVRRFASSAAARARSGHHIVMMFFHSGRTIRAAMDGHRLAFGRPARIQLATLVDRGHRELPIRAIT
jgi:pyrimidine operon attenuation protein/uracil phosphoribosyltransferase